MSSTPAAAGWKFVLSTAGRPVSYGKTQRSGLSRTDAASPSRNGTLDQENSSRLRSREQTSPRPSWKSSGKASLNFSQETDGGSADVSLLDEACIASPSFITNLHTIAISVTLEPVHAP